MNRRWFFNFINVIILTLGLILTLISNIRYGEIVRPLVFTGVVLSFSILYYILLDINKSESVNEVNTYKCKLEYVDLIVKDINKSLKSIKIKTKEMPEYKYVLKFLEGMEDLDNVTQKLAEDYKGGLEFIKKKSSLIMEIKKIDSKIRRTNGIVRENYEKTLKVKLLTLEEVKSIQTSLDETESKLHFILSTLEKTEAIMEATDAGDVLSDENTTELNMNLESFSENMKSVIKSWSSL